VAVEEDAALSQSVWGEGGINHFLPSEPEIRTIRYPERCCFISVRLGRGGN